MFSQGLTGGLKPADAKINYVIQRTSTSGKLTLTNKWQEPRYLSPFADMSNM